MQEKHNNVLEDFSSELDKLKTILGKKVYISLNTETIGSKIITDLEQAEDQAENKTREVYNSTGVVLKIAEDCDEEFKKAVKPGDTIFFSKEVDLSTKTMDMNGQPMNNPRCALHTFKSFAESKEDMKNKKKFKTALIEQYQVLAVMNSQ